MAVKADDVLIPQLLDVLGRHEGYSLLTESKTFLDSLPHNLRVSIVRFLSQAMFEIICGLLVGWPIEDLGVHIVSQDCSASFAVDCLKLGE